MDIEVEPHVTSLALKAFAPHPDLAVVVQPGGVLLAPAFVLKLGGKGSYASIPAIPAYNVGTGDLTVEAWFCSAQGGPLVTLGSAAAPVFAIAIDPNGDIVVSEAGTRIASIGRPSTALNSQWHHVAVSRASGVLAIYLDGVQQGTVTETTRFAISGATQLQFGAAAGQATSLVGNFAEVRLWNTARTQAQILANMFYRQATPTGLIGYWTFPAQLPGSSSPTQHNGGSRHR